MKFLNSKAVAFIMVIALIVTYVMPTGAMAEELAQETSDAVITETTDTEATEESLKETVEEEIPEGTTIVESAPTENKEKTILYVATNGDDNNPGTIDSPLASVVGARNKLREIRNSGRLAEGGAVVYVRGGTYKINKQIKLEKEDSGTKDAPVLYRNYPGEEVEFVGGAKLDFSKFTKVTDQAVLDRIVSKEARSKLVAVNLYDFGLTEIPDNVLPGPYSYNAKVLEVVPGLKKPAAQGPELVVNGKGQTIARYPNEGADELIIGEVVKQRSFETLEPFTIGINDERLSNWGNAKDAILTGTFQYSWGSGSVPIGEVDTKKLRITTAWPPLHEATVDQHVWVFNLIEEIDVPGEYYIDRNTGILYYYPIDEQIEEMYLTTLDETMLYMYGCEFITWKGIDLKYMCGSAGYIWGQDCKIIDCEVTFTGKYTLDIDGYRCQVLDCWFHDVERGIELRSYNGVNDTATLTKAENVIENSKFERCARVSKTYEAGVMLGRVGNTARYNDISDSIHLVAHISGNYNVFEFNEIYDACKDTDDMGALYSGRNLLNRGNEIRNNYFHDIGGANRGANGVHGIFFDDWWSAANVVGNVFANITGAGCMAAGSYNVFDNNIFYNCGESLRLTRSYNYGNPDNDAPFLDAIEAAKDYIYSDTWVEAFPTIVNVIDEDGKLDMNNYIVATDNVMINTPPAATSEEVKKTAIVERNLNYTKDPGFYDLENENFLLKEDSVIYTDNEQFGTIPFTRMGTYSDRAFDRVKDAFVYCIDSPWAIKKGEVVKSERAGAILRNGEVYLPVRCVAEAVNGEITYNEETEVIDISAGGKSLSFTDGDTEKVNINGVETTLELPVINIDYVNYVSVKEFVKIFNKHYVGTNGIVIVSDTYNLFHLDADKELLRYLEELITVY